MAKKDVPEVMTDELLVWQNSPSATILLQTIAIGADDPVDFFTLRWWNQKPRLRVSRVSQSCRAFYL